MGANPKIARQEAAKVARWLIYLHRMNEKMKSDFPLFFEEPLDQDDDNQDIGFPSYELLKAGSGHE